MSFAARLIAIIISVVRKKSAEGNPFNIYLGLGHISEVSI